MAPKPSPIYVYRGNKWSVITTKDLLPGDLFSLAYKKRGSGSASGPGPGSGPAKLPLPLAKTNQPAIGSGGAEDKARLGSFP